VPFVLHLLALAVFAQGTSEFMLSGLVQGIAADLDVSLPAAGLLTSAFAVGMVVGAPLMAVLTIRWSPRRSLLTFLSAFVGVHVVGALTTSYEVLLATRVVAALANAGFLAVALVVAVGMVAPTATGRATSVLLAGTTIACVAGVPAGAVLGQLWGWRTAFWAVALVSVPPLLGILRSVPARAPGAARPRAGRELRALRRPRLLVVLLLGALVNGGTFCALTYLAPLVTDVSGLEVGWVPAVLALFGVGSFAGVTVAGRLGDAHPVRLLTVGGVVLLAGWVGFALVAASPLAALAFVLVQGAFGFAVGATLIAQALRAATGAPTLAGAFATAALNVGAAFGPWLGGVALGAAQDARSPLWVSAGLVALALAVGIAAHALRRSTTPAPAAQPLEGQNGSM
jgi:DHA1 family chloramphenicol resistance protein-like MFS transporter